MRLIDADALMVAVEKEFEGVCVYDVPPSEAVSDFEHIVDSIPAVDAEPVRRGKRTVYTIWHSSAWGEIHTKFECCGFDVRGTKKYNYCPNCGARMDGERDEP